MTTYELEVAAYAAAHRIYNGLGQPDRACPGGYRVASIDKIAEAIMAAFEPHHEHTSPVPYSISSPRPRESGHGWITGTADMSMDALEPPPVPRCSDCKVPVGGQHRPSCHRQGMVTPDSDYGLPGLIQTRYWRQLRHAFDTGGSASFHPLRPCLKCGMTETFENHSTPETGEPLQPVNVEPAASNEAAISE